MNFDYLLALGIVLFLAFIFGRAFQSAKYEKEAKRIAYLKLQNGDKLITQIEKNMDVKEISRLLDTVPLDYQRESDGITPIMATMRYTYDTNYQNGYRRYRTLHEIAKRLPGDNLKTAINTQDKKGWTALMYAADQSDVLGGALLLHYGADPKTKNADGDTAAKIAARWPSIVPVFEGREKQQKFNEILLIREGKWP